MWKTFFQGPLSRPGQPLTPRTDSWRPHRLAGMFVRAARSCPQTRAAGLGKSPSRASLAAGWPAWEQNGPQSLEGQGLCWEHFLPHLPLCCRDMSSRREPTRSLRLRSAFPRASASHCKTRCPS